MLLSYKLMGANLPVSSSLSLDEVAEGRLLATSQVTKNGIDRTIDTPLSPLFHLNQSNRNEKRGAN